MSAAKQMADRGLNPLTWKRRHLVTWAVLILLGAAGGLLFGWVLSPFSRLPGADTGTLFIAWLQYPMAAWPYMAAGAVTAGLAYYAADLLTGAR
jgi:hypothetical protein